MLQVCFEWWAFEIIAIMAGLLPSAVVAIGANSLLLNISSMGSMIYLGISISGNVRVGNALGANDVKRARVAATTSIGMAAGAAIVTASFLILFRSRLPLLFTHDDDINALTEKLLVVAALFQLPDAINGAVMGILRGSGRQTLGAKMNFVAYYLLGVPLGCVLAFRLHWGVEGLWYGMTLGLISIASLGSFLVKKSDWKQLAMNAKERMDERGHDRVQDEAASLARRTSFGYSSSPVCSLRCHAEF